MKYNLPSVGIPTLTATAIVLLLTSSLTVSAQTDTNQPLSLANLRAGMAQCITGLNSGTIADAAITGRLCAEGLLVSSMLESATNVANVRGQARFGEHFRIINRLNYAANSDIVSGDIDVIVPFSFSDSAATGLSLDQTTRGWFLQQGLTTYKDAQSLRRNDTRYGLVHRFARAEKFGGGVFGVATLLQQNLEREHTRAVIGLDYAGKWGSSSLNYFRPLTKWRDGRLGYEERALAGLDLGLRFNLTSTIDLQTSASRWENSDGSGAHKTTGQLGVDWRPHSYLQVRTAYNEADVAGKDSSSLVLRFSRSYGGNANQPGWQGLGRHIAATAATPDMIYRPIDNIGRIEIAERVKALTLRADNTVEGASVQFVQTHAPTGSEIQLEVTIPVMLAAETRLRVQLIPGEGDNPAVPNEDYTDEAIEVVIPAGANRGATTIQLLHNPTMKASRSLDAQVFLGA